LQYRGRVLSASNQNVPKTLSAQTTSSAVELGGVRTFRDYTTASLMVCGTGREPKKEGRCSNRSQKAERFG
jgi:hypothetical protein